MPAEKPLGEFHPLEERAEEEKKGVMSPYLPENFRTLYQDTMAAFDAIDKEMDRVGEATDRIELLRAAAIEAFAKIPEGDPARSEIARLLGRLEDARDILVHDQETLRSDADAAAYIHDELLDAWGAVNAPGGSA